MKSRFDYDPEEWPLTEAWRKNDLIPLPLNETYKNIDQWVYREPDTMERGVIILSLLKLTLLLSDHLLWF